jgi:hypothetical protein
MPASEARRAERFEVLDRIGAAFKHETPEESEELAAKAVAEARGRSSSG